MLQGKVPALSLDPFTVGFVECGLGTCSLESGPKPDAPLRSKYTRKDIDIESLARMRDECLEFQRMCEPLYLGEDTYLGQKMDVEIHGRSQRGRESLAGYDFWHTRAGAGCGYWDGDWKWGDELTKACKKFDEPYLYVGDDGRIYYV
jgi:hypothetical protein